MWETWVRSLDWGDHLQEGIATHCSIQWGISMDRGTWEAVVLGTAESDTTERLSTAQHLIRLI